MDPVSALGVAAAVLQFVDASIKVSSAIKNASSIAERNKELEDDIRTAQDQGSRLTSASPSQGASDPVTELTSRCTSKSHELLTLLEYVRGSKKGRIGAAVRVLRNKDKIESLHASLVENRHSLNLLINQKLLSSVDLNTAVYTREFQNLDSFKQKLIHELAEQHKSAQDNNAVLSGKVDGVHNDMQLRFAQVDQSMIRDKILKSLFFPDMHTRRDQIKEPTPGTLDWLFSSTHEGSGHGATWSDFRQWLREDTSTYWISGKAGSGKSTLMAHLVQDKRTCQELNAWSSGHKLKVLSFFFWRAGSDLQKSISGLLRSLLYQLFSLQPAALDSIASDLVSPPSMVPTWTERALLKLISKAISELSKSQHYFCVFIDGLDEFTGSYDDLLDCIEQLQDLRYVKFCVSSRPEVELTHRLLNSKQLRLQDLNKNDIAKFVEQSFKKAKLHKHLSDDFVQDIAWEAQGGALARASDNKKLMRKRLNSLPRGMDQLFEQILHDMDPVYQESAAVYVQLMKPVTETHSAKALMNIPIITLAQLEKNINSYEEFEDECKRVTTEIITQSAGLLEVPRTFFLNHGKKWWDEAIFRYVSSQPRFTLDPADFDRRKCTKHEPYPTMLNYEALRMQWIHRSAFEFFANQPEESPLVKLSPSREVLLQRIAEGSIKYLVAAPSFNYPHMDPETGGPTMCQMAARLRYAVSFVFSWYSDYPKAASSILEKLHGVYTKCDSDELSGTERREWFDPATDIYTGEIAFWSDCSFYTHNLYPYMLSQMERILGDSASDTLHAHLLTVLVGNNSRYIGPDDCLAQIVASLAENLLQRIVRRFEIGTRYKCINSVDTSRRHKWGPFFWGWCFISASWKEPASDESLKVIPSLIYILSAALDRGLNGDTDLPISPSLFALMDITDLYVAPNFVLNRIYIQISAKALYMARYHQVKRWKYSRWRCSSINIGSCISANQVGSAVRVLCVPLLRRHPNRLERERDMRNQLWYPKWEPVTELQSSQFVSFFPSPAASDKLLGLIDHTYFAKGHVLYPRFTMVPHSRHLREEVWKMLLRDIKSPEQDLNGSQQLIAAACVRAGLLDPTFDCIDSTRTNDEPPDDETLSSSSGSYFSEEDS